MKDEYLYASETCMFSTKITIPETMIRYKRENIIVGITEFVDKIDEVLKKYNKNITFRAENITMDEFIDISNNLN